MVTVPKEGGYPEVVNFEGLGNCYYTLDVFACPLRGQWYLTGTVAKCAEEDLSSEYRIVRPTFHAVPVSIWVVGDPVLDPENCSEEDRKREERRKGDRRTATDDRRTGYKFGGIV